MKVVIDEFIQTTISGVNWVHSSQIYDDSRRPVANASSANRGSKGSGCILAADLQTRQANVTFFWGVFVIIYTNFIGISPSYGCCRLTRYEVRCSLNRESVHKLPLWQHFKNTASKWCWPRARRKPWIINHAGKLLPVMDAAPYFNEEQNEFHEYHSIL